MHKPEIENKPHNSDCHVSYSKSFSLVTLNSEQSMSGAKYFPLLKFVNAHNAKYTYFCIDFSNQKLSYVKIKLIVCVACSTGLLATYTRKSGNRKRNLEVPLFNTAYSSLSFELVYFISLGTKEAFWPLPENRIICSLKDAAVKSLIELICDFGLDYITSGLNLTPCITYQAASLFLLTPLCQLHAYFSIKAVALV